MAKQTEIATEAPVAPTLSAEQFAQLLQVMASQKSTTLDADTLATILQKTAESTAKAMQKAMKPENPQHPGISAFSHKDGDLAMPKPPLPYELFWNGYPVHKFPETETWREWVAQSNIPGIGTYTVLRNDASKMVVSVTGEFNADGKPTKLTVTHPSTREDKDKVPPKTAIIAQMQNPADPKTAFIASMQEQIAAMFGES